MTKKEWWLLVGLAEFIIWIASVLTVVGPSKTPSKWRVASLVLEAPMTSHEIVAWVVLSHGFIAMVGVAIWLYKMLQRRAAPPS